MKNELMYTNSIDGILDSTMEIVEMDAYAEMGALDEVALTAEQKQRNYLEIAETLSYIEAGGRITEDFTCECKWMLIKWRDWVPDFRYMNEDNETIEYRTLCTHTEEIMSTLYHDIMTTNNMNFKMFTVLLRHLKKMCDSTFEDDALADMLNSMNM